MSTITTIRKILNNIDLTITRALLIYGEKKNTGEKEKKQIQGVTFTKQQKKEINDYFLKYYGKKVPLAWHKLYTSYTGVFNINYFPEILFSSELEPITNPRATRELLGDKNMLQPLFGCVKNLHIPTTMMSCVKGIYRDGDNRLVSFSELTSVFAKCKCVIKKTIDTSSGRDVQVCDFTDGKEIKTGESWNTVLQRFGKNFVVQECIRQNEGLNRLYPFSINTFRIVTYIVDNQINVSPIALRMGSNGNAKDNIHNGGLFVGVSQDGRLMSQAFLEFGEAYKAHPNTGIVFDGYQIPYMKSVVEATKKCHACCPWLGILSWDMTIDENGVPVLIEVNTGGQSACFPQEANGEPLFGEDTPYMLAKIRK